MTGHRDSREDGYERARDPEEPGAHSGSESQSRERTVPGTASAKEGYQQGRGTSAGNPLEGVEADEESDGDTRGDGG
ncbi:hypothetical protein [Streptomyces minutiscleroticus]|uniref:Uncharacterized protein n=1 Tax=Streptomyces minutiscleroticus TaxID=68238 RepID=A0A918NU46_9ACTN|nr:hypothetical protein [Streptomyces minutiscleroticus]GGX96624.1 hypothetical protein GCM10010358_58070 [Streptomyces minutiscleroticus]